MLVIFDENTKKVLGCFQNAKSAEVPDTTVFPTPEQQMGKTATLVIDPSSDVLSYNYANRPLTDSEKADDNANTMGSILMALVEGGIL